MADSNELAQSIARSLNASSEKGRKIAFSLDDEDSPTKVKEWVSTGSTLLDLAISNRADGGLPVGKIVEFYGLPGSGKSLIASHVLAKTQDKGGIAVYIDTESAVDPDFLETIGIDRDKGFIYVQEHRASKIFEIIERVVSKIRDKDNKKFVTVVVDSIAGMTTESEDASEHGKEGYATDKAIILSKSMRKLTNLLGRERILLVFTNQVRDNVGCVAPETRVTFRQSTATPEGEATAYSAARDGSVEQLFENAGHDWRDMEQGSAVDVSGQGLQLQSAAGAWRDVEKLVRKSDAEAWTVTPLGGDYDPLVCTAQHRVRVKHDGSVVFREVQHLNPETDRIQHNNAWKRFSVEQTDRTIPVLDFQLAPEHDYLAHGITSHNTMYGDKFVTPGGKAVPFHSSVRVELRKSKSIIETVGGQRNQVGAQIRPKVTKNRLGPPGRKCEFDLYFSSGIDDAGSFYDKLKAHGVIKHKGGGHYRLKAREDKDHEWYQEGGDDFTFRKNDSDADDAFFRVINRNDAFKERCFEHLYEHEVMSYDRDWTGSADKEYVEAEDADPREAGKPGVSDHNDE